MEGNRDEADRCIEIALCAINESNYSKAEKFLRKAEILYSSPRAKDLLFYVSNMSAGGASASRKSENNLQSSKADAPSESSKPRSTEQDYTQEQLEVVKGIRKCKDYYEVLGITKEATDSEVRKAYKKLAFQLHPDKNKAPGAAEAFKAVGNAVSVLTDSRKRKEYELYGTQVGNHSQHRRHSPDAQFAHHRFNGDHEYAYARGFESDISAEELFNMFFGGFPQQRMNRQRYTEHRDNQQPSLAFGLILLLVIISVMSSFFTPDPLYSLAPTAKYTAARKTHHFSIPYYVKDTFLEEYQGSLARLENSVEEDYIATMKQNCYREKNYRDSMISRARSFGSRSQVVQAQGLKVPSCENLVKIGLTRYSYY